MAKSKKTIAVDFDGVIHAYRKHWHDGTIYDEPIPGAKEAMETLKRLGFDIVIYSTRNFERTVDDVLQKSQATEVYDYLIKHRIPFSRVHTEPGKPLCVAFIDDNAVHFTNWPQALADTIQLCFRCL